MPAETPGAGPIFAVAGHPLTRPGGAERAEIVARAPMGGGAPALQQPRRAEDERAGADRAGASRGRVNGGQPGPQRLVAELAPNRVALAAGDDQHVRLGLLVDAGVGVEGEEMVAGADKAGAAGDEADLHLRKPAQRFVGTDRVEGGDSVEQVDEDSHGGSLSSSPQRRLGPPGVKDSALFTRRGPSLRRATVGAKGPFDQRLGRGVEFDLVAAVDRLRHRPCRAPLRTGRTG